VREYKWHGGISDIKVNGYGEGIGGIDTGRFIVDGGEGVEGRPVRFGRGGLDAMFNAVGLDFGVFKPFSLVRKPFVVEAESMQ